MACPGRGGSCFFASICARRWASTARNSRRALSYAATAAACSLLGAGGWAAAGVAELTPPTPAATRVRTRTATIENGGRRGMRENNPTPRRNVLSSLLELKLAPGVILGTCLHSHSLRVFRGSIVQHTPDSL